MDYLAGAVGSSVAIKNGVLTEAASCASATSRVARNRKFMICLERIEQDLDSIGVLTLLLVGWVAGQVVENVG